MNMEDKFLTLMEEKGHVLFLGLREENPNYTSMMNHLDNQIEFAPIQVSLKMWIREKLMKSKKNFIWNEERKARVRRFLSQGMERSLNTHEHTLLNTLYDEECSFVTFYTKQITNTDVKKIHKHFFENPEQLQDFQKEMMFRLSNDHPEIYKEMLSDFIKTNNVQLKSKLEVINTSSGLSSKERNLLKKMKKYNSFYK